MPPESSDPRPRQPLPRRFVRWAGWALLILVIALALVWKFGLSAATRYGITLAVTADGSLADLRNDTVRNHTEESIVAGREALEAAARRHGLKEWRSHDTVSVTAVDRWTEDNHPWWPAPSQRFRQDALIGTFTSRVRLLDGPAAGEVRGLQSWRSYRVEPGGTEPKSLSEPELAIEFYLPTLQYFNELPLRLLTAELVAHAGEIRHHGRDYELVFATWEGWEPREELDQYVAWIGKDSGLIEKLHYTLRDAIDMAEPERRDLVRKGAVGTMHFADFREVGGVVFPFRQYVTLFGPDEAPGDLEADAMHTVFVESVEFDVVDPRTLTPLPDLPPPSGGKPTVEPGPGSTSIP